MQSTVYTSHTSNIVCFCFCRPALVDPPALAGAPVTGSQFAADSHPGTPGHWLCPTTMLPGSLSHFANWACGTTLLSTGERRPIRFYRTVYYALPTDDADRLLACLPCRFCIHGDVLVTSSILPPPFLSKPSCTTVLHRDPDPSATRSHRDGWHVCAQRPICSVHFTSAVLSAAPLGVLHDPG